MTAMLHQRKAGISVLQYRGGRLEAAGDGHVNVRRSVVALWAPGADPSGGATANGVRASGSRGIDHRTCARDRIPREPLRRSG